MTMHISPPAAAPSDAGFHVRTLMRPTFVRRLAFTINWPAIERGLAAIVTDINKLDREIAMLNEGGRGMETAQSLARRARLRFCTTRGSTTLTA